MQSFPGAIDTRDLLSVCRTGDTVDRTLLREILGYFLEANAHRLTQATDAIGTGNRDALSQVAHAMRGSAAIIGAGRLHDLAWSLELDARTGDFVELHRGIDALREELGAVARALHHAHPEAWM